MRSKPIAAGKSSFQLLDEAELFRKLPLRQNATVLDAACGIGDYSLAMAEHLGNQATIYAADLWEEGIKALRRTAAQRNLSCIRPVLADLSLFKMSFS